MSSPAINHSHKFSPSLSPSLSPRSTVVSHHSYAFSPTLSPSPHSFSRSLSPSPSPHAFSPSLSPSPPPHSFSPSLSPSPPPHSFSPSLSPSPPPRTGAGAGATTSLPASLTPTFSRGSRSRRRLQSLVTGRPFHIARAPTRPRRMRSDHDGRQPRRNIADGHARQYQVVRQWAWDRAGVLRRITSEIIDLITATTTATTTPEIINLITPSSSSSAATSPEVIDLIIPSTAALTPEIIDLVTPTATIEIIDLLTPNTGATAGSGASFLTPSTYDRP